MSEESSVFDADAMDRLELAKLWVDEIGRLYPGYRISSILCALALMRIKEMSDASQRP